MDYLARLLLRETHVAAGFGEVPLREFGVKLMYQGHAFFARDLAISDFVRRVRSTAPNAELDICQVVVQPVESVIETCVF